MILEYKIIIDSGSIIIIAYIIIFFYACSGTICASSSKSNSGKSVWDSQKYLQYAHLKLGLPSSVYLDRSLLRINARSTDGGNSAWLARGST